MLNFCIVLANLFAKFRAFTNVCVQKLLSRNFKLNFTKRNDCKGSLSRANANSFKCVAEIHSLHIVKNEVVETFNGKIFQPNNISVFEIENFVLYHIAVPDCTDCGNEYIPRLWVSKLFGDCVEPIFANVKDFAERLTSTLLADLFATIEWDTCFDILVCKNTLARCKTANIRQRAHLIY